MKKIVDTIQLKRYESKAFDLYFRNKSYAVFDIETTGLSPASSKLILSGILLVNGDEGQVVQLFADQPEDEKEIIMETLRLLESVDLIVTYNGKHFDLPFLVSRAKKHGIGCDSLPYNLDLYLVVNGYSPLREVLPSLRQKSIEVYMGISDGRDDEISGGDSVALYNRYMATKSFELEKKILLHNHDDVVQLNLLLPIIAKVDFHRAMYKLGFLADQYQIGKINISGHDLCVNGMQKGNPKDYISFPTEKRPYSLVMNSKDKTFELTISGEASAGAVYIDAQGLLDDTSSIKKYPSYADGYLILTNNGEINYLEINAFLMEFFKTNISALI